MTGDGFTAVVVIGAIVFTPVALALSVYFFAWACDIRSEWDRWK